MPRFLAAAAVLALLPVQTQPPHGLTVTGTAMLRIPATAARIALTVTSADRKLTLTKATLQPIVQAMIKAGAQSDDVRLPVNFDAPGGSNVATITATIEHPSVAEMSAGVVSVGSVISQQRDLILSSALVELTAQNCAATLDRVRREAVQHAKAKAESLASDLGVHVGSAVNVNSFDQLSPEGACRSTYSINGYGGFNPMQPQTPQDFVTVPVTANVTITYAIK